MDIASEIIPMPYDKLPNPKNVCLERISGLGAGIYDIKTILMLAWNGNMKVISNCIRCGKEVVAYRYNGEKAVYCSRECRDYRTLQHCLYCGEEFYVQRWHLENGYGKYCSRSCSSKHNYPKINRLANREKLGEFTELQKQVIIGSLLGDGSLHKPKNGVNYHFSVAHCAKQKEYLEYKRQLLYPFSSEIDIYSRLDKRYNHIYTSHRFSTKSHPYLTELEKLFYTNRVKKIPLVLIEQMAPIALAMWYLDDGNVAKRTHQLASVCFEFDELEEACEIISAKFDLMCYPQKSRRIFIASESNEKFISIIEPFTPTSMRYKL